jgi:hypothetical protein
MRYSSLIVKVLFLFNKEKYLLHAIHYKKLLFRLQILIIILLIIL